MFKIHIIYAGLRDFERGLENSPEINKGFIAFAKIIVKYWKDRYRRNAKGAQWKKLEATTIAEKKRRNLSGDPELILTETGQLYRGISYKITKSGALMGYINTSELHVDPLGEHTRLITVEKLAAIHDVGKYPMPQRIILSEPPERTIQRATKELDEQGVAYLLRRTRRS